MKWMVKLMHAFDKKQRAYVSPADELLQQFDHAHPEKSISQIKEINKHANIFNRKPRSRLNWK